MGTSPSRRRYLTALGAAALGGLAGCQTRQTPTPTETTATPTETQTETTTQTPDGPPELRRHGIQFSREVDLVADLGADPTGNQPINDILTTAATAGTLIRIPEGRYQFDGRFTFGADTVGLLGEGDVQFIPPVEFDRILLDTNGGVHDEILIENIDIDLSAPDTTAGIRIQARSRFHVEDVEYLGRGVDTMTGQVSAFLLSVSDPDGVGTLRRAVSKQGSRIDAYVNGNGRIAVWVGWDNKGTIRIEECDFREFGNNACYTSRTPGTVQIVDSYFCNNNASSIRLGGKGSYAENCTIEIDLDKYTGPPLETTETGFNTRAIVVETGVQLNVPAIEPGAEIRNCTVLARNSPKSQSLIELSPQGRSMIVTDTTIVCDLDNTPAIRRAKPGELPWRPYQQIPPEPHWISLENVTITGTARGGEAVRIEGGTDSVIRNCTIEQTGDGRDGVRFIDTVGCRIDGGEIDAGRYPVTVQYSGIADGQCLVKLGDVPQLTSHEIAVGEMPVLHEIAGQLSDACIVTAAPPYVSGTHQSIIRIADIREEASAEPTVRVYGDVLFEA